MAAARKVRLLRWRRGCCGGAVAATVGKASSNNDRSRDGRLWQGANRHVPAATSRWVRPGEGQCEGGQRAPGSDPEEITISLGIACRQRRIFRWPRSRLQKQQSKASRRRGLAVLLAACKPQTQNTQPDSHHRDRMLENRRENTFYEISTKLSHHWVGFLSRVAPGVTPQLNPSFRQTKKPYVTCCNVRLYGVPPEGLEPSTR